MRFAAPERPRVGDRPAWGAAPQLALPDPVIGIGLAEHTFVVRLLLASSQTSGRWVETAELRLTEVAKLLVDWYEGPEEALVLWWPGAEPPDSSQWGARVSAGPKEIISAADIDVNDLGL